MIVHGGPSCVGVQLRAWGSQTGSDFGPQRSHCQPVVWVHCADEPAQPLRHHLWVRSLGRAQRLMCRFHSGNLSRSHGHELSDRLLWTGRPWVGGMLVGPGLSAAVTCICNYLLPFAGRLIVWPRTSAGRKVCFVHSSPCLTPHPMTQSVIDLAQSKETVRLQSL